MILKYLQASQIFSATNYTYFLFSWILRIFANFDKMAQKLVRNFYLTIKYIVYHFTISLVYQRVIEFDIRACHFCSSSE